MRDKLLSAVQKNDIDIALDNMTGNAFLAIVNKWNQAHDKRPLKIGVIQLNPEKSKHLETGNAAIIYSRSRCKVIGLASL